MLNTLPIIYLQMARTRTRRLLMDRWSGLLLESGGGRPLVVLASPFVLALSYRPLLERLRRSFRVTVVEMPGCGSGSRLPAPWTLERYAGWVGMLLEQLGLDDVTLIGHSDSGAVALIAAAGQPARIGRVVLADSVGADTAGSISRILWGRFVDSFLELDLSVAGWPHLLYNAFAHTRNFFHLILEASRADLLEYAPRVHVPVLLAWGGQDHTMPLRCAQAYRRHLPDARLYVSRSGSHDWLITNADEFAGLVSGFAKG